jgi:hypothetical protein
MQHHATPCNCAHVALGGNLGGITSFLLGLDGGSFAANTSLDVLVPVLGHMRCVNYAEGFGGLFWRV